LSYPEFGPDGTVYFLTRDPRDEYQQNLVALDTAGHVKPGWPIEAPSGSDFGSPAVGPDGSVYIEERGSPEVGSVLHRLGASGQDLPGWPFEVPASFTCPAGQPYYIDDPRTPAVNDPCHPPSLDIAPNGTAYLRNHRPAGPRLIAIDPSGEIRPGWPIALDDQEWTDQQLGSDGTVFLLRRPIGSQRWDAVRGVIDDDAELWAFSPNGQPRPGWPVPVPNIGSYLLATHGTVVVWSLIDLVGELCAQPRRTVFTVLDPDGRTRPGWPRGSTGYASSPVVGADGTVYYISALGNVYAHDLAGEIKAGWPAAVPGAFNWCSPTGPFLAPDGTIYVLGDEVSALSPDGRSRPGWPYRPTGQLSWSGELDTDGGPAHVAPAFGPDDTVYVVAFHTDSAGTQAEVVALDRKGQLKRGWPYRLPWNPAPAEIGQTVSPDGRLYVRGGNSLLALDPDGRISD
jgi:outer membrane protein assembly factor BamB